MKNTKRLTRGIYVRREGFLFFNSFATCELQRLRKKVWERGLTGRINYRHYEKIYMNMIKIPNLINKCERKNWEDKL